MLLIASFSEVISKIKQMGLEDKIEISQLKYAHNTAFVGISKKSSLIKEKRSINEVIKKMLYNGEIDKIFTPAVK